jgi:hypothetical protein
MTVVTTLRTASPAGGVPSRPANSRCTAPVPPATQRELLAGVGAAIDAAGGSFTMGYTAVVATAARTGRPGTS